MTKTDVTNNFSYGDVDGEQLPIIKCICGEFWWPWEGLVLSIDYNDPEECPSCHRKFVFSNKIIIYEIEDEVSGN